MQKMVASTFYLELLEQLSLPIDLSFPIHSETEQSTISLEKVRQLQLTKCTFQRDYQQSNAACL
jgi:hypothetical protein